MLNKNGEECFYVHEDHGNVIMRQLCKNHRGFVMHFYWGSQEVMKIERKFKCCAGCCCCISGYTCAHVINVEAPVGTLVGQVRQAHSLCTPLFDITDTQGQRLHQIVGPICPLQGPCCTADTNFRVVSDSQEIGKVARVYSGCANECFTKANSFRVDFGPGLDWKSKALIFGSTFLIDMMFFENDQ